MNTKLVARAAAASLHRRCLASGGVLPGPAAAAGARDVAPLTIVDPAKPCSRLGSARGRRPERRAAVRGEGRLRPGDEHDHAERR